MSKDSIKKLFEQDLEKKAQDQYTKAFSDLRPKDQNYVIAITTKEYEKKYTEPGKLSFLETRSYSPETAIAESGDKTDIDSTSTGNRSRSASIDSNSTLSSFSSSSRPSSPGFLDEDRAPSPKISISTLNTKEGTSITSNPGDINITESTSTKVKQKRPKQPQKVSDKHPEIKTETIAKEHLRGLGHGKYKLFSDAEKDTAARFAKKPNQLLLTPNFLN